ncbi:hypothetical protein [Nocardioides pyridinolyticus]
MRPVDTASAAYAAEVARLLWPEPWAAPELTRGRPAPGHRDAYVFPSARRPRLLVPADLPGSASMLRRLGSDRSYLAGPARRVLERSVRSRAFTLLRWPVLRVRAVDPGADSIEHHLSDHLGTEVRVGVLLGTRRANQKPVLQVFRLDGSVLGYAKLGHNDLTASLVRREAAALNRIGTLLPHSFHAPRVLLHTSWSGLEVLMTSDLPTTGRPVTHSALLSASREIAGLGGTTRSTLAGSGYWWRRRSAITELSGTPQHARLRTAVRVLGAQHGTTPLTLGGSHGDWGAWNMGMAADGALQVWDWERYDAEVPAGFDALHFAAQQVRPGERDERRQEAAFLDAVPHLLDELGVRPSRHEATLRLYLLEMALRYVDAQRHDTTPALQRRTAWVLSLLERRLDGAETTALGGTP